MPDPSARRQEERRLLIAMEQVTRSVQDRKADEIVFHDELRQIAPTGTTGAPNRRFYELGFANHAFTVDWLRVRCRGARVLDYCCGDGATAILASQLGAREVVGIDISQASIELARRNATAAAARAVRYEVMDAERMTFDARSFDVIVVSGVLHHLDLDLAYRELARVVAAQGTVLCTEALRHNPVIRWYRRRTPELRTPWETEHILGRRQVFAAEQYFDVVRLERFFHLTTLATVPLIGTRAFRPALSVGEALDSVVLNLPGIRWLAWQAVFSLSRPKECD